MAANNPFGAWTVESLKQHCSVADLTVVTRLTLPNIDTRQISCAPIGHLLPNLHNLELIGYVPSVRDLGTQFRNLTTLTLSRVQLIDLDGVHAFPVLRELFLSHNLIRDLSPLAFADSLRVLDLAHNQVSSWDQMHELAALEGLRTLNLFGNPLPAVEGFESKVVSILPSLRTLNEQAVSALLQQQCTAPSPIAQLIAPSRGIDSATVSTPVETQGQREAVGQLGRESAHDGVCDKLAVLFLSTMTSHAAVPLTTNVALATVEVTGSEPGPARLVLSHRDPLLSHPPTDAASWGNTKSQPRRPSRSHSPQERNLKATTPRLPPLALIPSSNPADPSILVGAEQLLESSVLPSAPIQPSTRSNIEYPAAPVRPQAQPPPTSSAARRAGGGARFRRLSAPAPPPGLLTSLQQTTPAVPRSGDSA